LYSIPQQRHQKKKNNSINKKKDTLCFEDKIEKDFMASKKSVDRAGNQLTQSKSAIPENVKAEALQEVYEKYRSYWNPQFAVMRGSHSLMFPAFLLCRTLEREFLMFFLHSCFK